MWTSGSVGRHLQISRCHSVGHQPDNQMELSPLPYGWEKVNDPEYGIYYIDHISRKTQYDHPPITRSSSVDATECSVMEPIRNNGNVKETNLDKENRNISTSGACACNRPLCLSKNNVELQGEFIRTQLTKSPRGLGFTIVSADDFNVELLQIKTILPNGPADVDGRLKRGDVLVYVDLHCVVGFTHSDVINLFQSIPIGSKVNLEVCRGYPLPFDPDDPSNEVITTVAVTLPSCCNLPPPPVPFYHCGYSVPDAGTDRSLPLLPVPHSVSCQQQHVGGKLHPPEMTRRNGGDGKSYGDTRSLGPTELMIVVVKGNDGFGFTIAGSSVGQKIKQVLDRERCKNLTEGDVITQINGINLIGMAHLDVVEILKNCPINKETILVIQRGGRSSRRRQQSDRTKITKQDDISNDAVKTSPVEMSDDHSETHQGNLTSGQQPITHLETGNSLSQLSSHQFAKSSTYKEHETTTEQDDKRTKTTFPDNALLNRCISGTPDYIPASAYHSPLSGRLELSCVNQSPINKRLNTENFSGLCQSPFGTKNSKKNLPTTGDSRCVQCETELYNHTQERLGQGKESDDELTDSAVAAAYVGHPPQPMHNGFKMTVRLNKQESGFGIRIVGGIEEGSQVAIGFIVAGGAADVEGHLEVGDQILSVNQQSVIGASHHQVVALMSQSASRLGFVILDVWKHANPLLSRESGSPSMHAFDVVLTRKDGEGFGFVIVSSVTKAGSIVAQDFDLYDGLPDWVPNFKRPYPWLGKIIEGSPAGCCDQLHVGDYILAINGVDIGNMPHQEIVNFIKASGLSIVLTVAPVNCTASMNRRCNSVPKLPYPEKEDVFYLIELKRGARGFGFSIRGGKEFDGMPLYILKVADDGPAHADGQLQVGDQIVEINGCNTLEMLHTEAIDLIQNTGPSLSLLVKRPASILQLSHDQSELSNSEVAANMNRKGSQRQNKVMTNTLNH